MLMKRSLTPDLLLSSFREVTPELCRSMGISCIVSDIDNTLATYDDEDMPTQVRLWCDSLREAGIGVAFVSNNNGERVTRFAGDTGIPVFPDAKKPSPKAFLAAMEQLRCSSGGAVLGDQLLTDALAAHRAGMVALTVPPIKDRTGLFFRFKRWIERPYIKGYMKKHPNCTVHCPEWGI